MQFARFLQNIHFLAILKATESLEELDLDFVQLQKKYETRKLSIVKMARL